MTSSRTRQSMLAHTHYNLMNRLVAFDPYEQSSALWDAYLHNLERSLESLRIQRQDYAEALEFEAEATRQAEAEYRKEKDAEEPNPIF